MKWNRLFALLAAIACTGLFVAASTATPPSAIGPGEEAGSTMPPAYSSADCADCHDEHVEAFAVNPHAALDLPEWGGDGSCISCHGEADSHIDEGGGEGTIFAFTLDDAASVKNDTCQSCHAGDHPRFDSTPHAAAGLACSDCHSIHSAPSAGGSLLAASGRDAAGPLSRLDAVSASCADCHGDVLAQFGLNERHRLQEGILSCGSCHDPHEPPTVLALGGFKGETCVECHVDKAGPFVFEHGAQRVEGCTACHTPHGSVNRHMLTFQRPAELCYSCHATVPGFHSRFTLDSVCTNCHSTIHGSNFDLNFLK